MRRVSRRLQQTVLFVVVLTTLTVLSTSAAQATTTISNRTIDNLSIAAGTHDRVYDHCTFTGGSSAARRAVIQIAKSCYNITFRDCVIKSGPWNGVSVNDSYGRIHDITFLRCTFRPQRRMGLEVTSRPVSSTTGYRNIWVRDCTFAPQGSEAISFDGGAGCVDNGVTGTVIKGAGTNRAFDWGQGFELNGPRCFTFTGNRVYQCRESLLNLSYRSDLDCDWTFSGNRLDATVHYQRVRMARASQVVCAKGIRGGDLRANYVRSSAPGGGVAWFGDCRGMDWSGTSWRDARGGLWLRPYQEMGSAGNVF